MPHSRSEYERALSVAGQTSPTFQTHGCRSQASTAGSGNILLSGNSRMKLKLLLGLMEQVHAMPMVVVSDSQRSGLAAILRQRKGANFSFVRCAGESAYYNFLRHKSEREMLQFFSQTAAEHGLFGQRQVEAETLLQCILRLSQCTTDIFDVLAEGRLTGSYLSGEIESQYRRGRLGDRERVALLANMNSSVSAVQSVSLAFQDLFAVLANMRGIPFSVKDIVDQQRRVCFCLDSSVTIRSPCWYLAEMLQYDLRNCLSKTRKPFLLVLDMSSREKLALFSSLIGIKWLKIILNVDHAEYLTGNYSVSQFPEIYVFSHMDFDSAKYWSDYFSTHKAAEYTYSSSNSATNRCPLLPFSLGSLFGEVSKGNSVSYRLVDKPIFEINEIRELSDSEVIYFSSRDRRPSKVTFR